MSKLLTIENVMVGYPSYLLLKEKAKSASPETIHAFVNSLKYKSTKDKEKAIANWNPSSNVSTKVNKANSNNKNQKLNEAKKEIGNIIKAVCLNKDLADKLFEDKTEIKDAAVELIKNQFAETLKSQDADKLLSKDFINTFLTNIRKEFGKNPEVIKAVDELNIDEFIESHKGKDSIISDLLDKIIPNSILSNNIIDVDPSELKVVDSGKTLPEPLEPETAVDDSEVEDIIEIIDNLDDVKKSVIFAHKDESDIDDRLEYLQNAFRVELNAAIRTGKLTKSNRIIVTPLSEDDWELVSVEDVGGYYRQYMAIRISGIYDDKPSVMYYDRSANNCV